MNFFLTVDNYWNLSKQQNNYKLKENLNHIKSIIQNKVIVYDNNFLLNTKIKDFKKGNLAVCFTNENIDGEQNVVNNFKELFEFLSFYNEDNIFVLGDEDFIKSLLLYCKKAYITKLQITHQPQNNFPNLDKDENWELVNTSNPVFENNIVYYFCEYVNKKPLKFNYGYEEDDLI